MTNKYFMQTALKLAEKGIGNVCSNPLVGAVIVKDNKIIRKGYHKKFGEAHAEINALNNIRGKISGASLFVTLEPCCHHGKTPPCTDAIIKSGIKKVIIGMEDPNPKVSGKGIKILTEHGIKIEFENLNGKINKFYETFKKFIIAKQPFVTLKMAMSLDGKIASYTGDSHWISNEKARVYVHKFRRKNDAILVGVETIIKDNPKLTPYLIKTKTPLPLRIILDPNLRIPKNSFVLNDGNPTLIVTSKNINSFEAAKLKSKQTKILFLQKNNNNKFDLSSLLSELGKEGITSVLVEGGGNTAASFLEQKLIDKIIFFIAPKIIGGKDALTPVEGCGIKDIKDAIIIKDLTIIKINSDILYTGYPEYK